MSVLPRKQYGLNRPDGCVVGETAPRGQRLKCRWCAYTCAAFYRTKDGKAHNGYQRLLNHVDDWHPWMMRALDAALDRDDPDVKLLDDPCTLQPGYVPSDPGWREDEAWP